MPPAHFSHLVVFPAHQSQRTLPKMPLLCQPPQIFTCPVRNITGSTLSQIKCKLLSLATQALNSLLRIRHSTQPVYPVVVPQTHKADGAPDLCYCHRPLPGTASLSLAHPLCLECFTHSTPQAERTGASCRASWRREHSS